MAPVIMERGERIYLYDIDGNKYYDMMAGFAAVAQGHCNPKIRQALIDQSGKLHLCSRSLNQNVLPKTAEYLCNMFGYDKLLPQSSGVEAVETCVKVARRWGYAKKGVPDGHANILNMLNSFWGRSVTACGNSGVYDRGHQFGPHTPGFAHVEYNNVNAIEDHLKKTPNCVAVMMEPLQGEGGIIVPSPGFLADVRRLCDKYNVLMICDEVQSGIGRTGHLLAQMEDLAPIGRQADLTAVGKSLSGGFLPISATFGTKEVMGTLMEGEHGSTFGGNPLAMAVARASMEVINEENLVENSQKMGEIFRANFRKIQSSTNLIRDVRGRGLMNCIEIERDSKVNGHDFCNILI